MKSAGNRPPIEIKNKDRWIMAERLRWAKQFQIPMCENTPEPFPQATLQTQRALCAVQLLEPGKLTACFEALYQAFWVEGQSPIGKVEVFGPVLAKVLGEGRAKEVRAQFLLTCHWSDITNFFSISPSRCWKLQESQRRRNCCQRTRTERSRVALSGCHGLRQRMQRERRRGSGGSIIWGR